MTKALLLLILVGLLAMMASRWLRGALPRKPESRAIETAAKCPRCGAYRIAGQPCATPGCGG
ncbi:MAG: hypothetical protein ABTQ27_06105 [Amaricoccus sp.]|uniref:hypothetical protein n=1 Tax=Amaricoccus sp. TaxID=1872485 RepID=UPI003315910D